MGEWVDILSNLFAGVGIILLWENWWKPRQERRSLMAALAAEVHHNIVYMDAHLEVGERDDSQVPPDFRVPTTIYTALASRLGELPAGTVGRLVSLYRQLEELNRIPQIFADLVAHHRATTNSAVQHNIGEEITLCISSFYGLLATVQAHAKVVLPLLGGPPPPLPPDARAREANLSADAWSRNLRIRVAGAERRERAAVQARDQHPPPGPSDP